MRCQRVAATAMPAAGRMARFLFAGAVLVGVADCRKHNNWWSKWADEGEAKMNEWRNHLKDKYDEFNGNMQDYFGDWVDCDGNHHHFHSGKGHGHGRGKGGGKGHGHGGNWGWGQDGECKAEKELKDMKGELKAAEKARVKCARELEFCEKGRNEVAEQLEDTLDRCAASAAQFCGGEEERAEAALQRLRESEDARRLLHQRLEEEMANAEDRLDAVTAKTSAEHSEAIVSVEDRWRLYVAELEEDLENSEAEHEAEAARLAAEHSEALAAVEDSWRSHLMEEQARLESLISECEAKPKQCGRSPELQGCLTKQELLSDKLFLVSLGSLSVLALLVAMNVAYQLKACKDKLLLQRSKQEAQDARQELVREVGECFPPATGEEDVGEFQFSVFDEQHEQETLRIVKIACLGVLHSDICVDILFNGCEVKIEREASPGVPAATWHRAFRFRPSDGLFDFLEDQATLKSGFLQLVFRAKSPKLGVFRFPEHFDMSTSDLDCSWTFEASPPPSHQEPAEVGAALLDQAEAPTEEREEDEEEEESQTNGASFREESAEEVDRVVRHDIQDNEDENEQQPDDEDDEPLGGTESIESLEDAAQRDDMDEEQHLAQDAAQRDDMDEEQHLAQEGAEAEQHSAQELASMDDARDAGIDGAEASEQREAERPPLPSSSSSSSFDFELVMASEAGSAGFEQEDPDVE